MPFLLEKSLARVLQTEILVERRVGIRNWPTLSIYRVRALVTSSDADRSSLSSGSPGMHRDLAPTF